MPITCTCMGSQPPSVVRWLTRALGGSVLWQACSRLVLPRSSGRNDGYQSEFLPHNQGGEGNSRKERMFLEPRESHRLCPFQALVHLRAGALGSCERERSGQRGMERTKGHTEGPWPAELGRRCWSSWQPASPGSLFVGREAAFQEAGSSAPPESWGSCIWKWSRKADVNRSSPLCRRSLGSRVGFGQHSGFSEKRQL